MERMTKAAGVELGGVPTPAQLEQINRQAKTALTAEEVYVFSLRLCDDQPDRDDERFDTNALPELAALMVGKTGLCDHNWSASEQVARIFSAEVEQEDGVHYIRAWAYLLRAHHEQLIEEIEGGIRREVSIGCAMGQRRCSICGAEMGTCAHQKGCTYGTQRCVAVLSQPLDAYEFSFVAVPAQPMAAVMKQYGASLEQMAQAAGGAAWEEYQKLFREAGIGKAAADTQRAELVRLGMALELGLDRPLLERMAAAMSAADVQTVCTAWHKSLQVLYPAQTQLGPIAAGNGDEEFLI